MPFLIDRKHISVHQALFLHVVYQATVSGTLSRSFQAFPIYEHPLYSMAGYFCWCKILWKCVLTLQKKFSWFLFLQNQCGMLWLNPYQYQCTRTMTSSISILVRFYFHGSRSVRENRNDLHPAIFHYTIKFGDLVQIRQFAKLKSPQKFPAIRYFMCAHGTQSHEKATCMYLCYKLLLTMLALMFVLGEGKSVLDSEVCCDVERRQ